MRRTSSVFCSVLLIATAFAFFSPNTVVTDVSAEVVEGEGNCFEITNSTYLNVTLCSSEIVNVSLESIPEVVSYIIQAVGNVASTSVSLSGFVPNGTYYRHEDGYLKESFVADKNGSYSYTQDLAAPHHVFIAEEVGTKYIRDTENGGDCYLIGTWDGLTKTCTLTGDVYEMIVLASSDLTLDGNGWSVSGSFSYGVYASGKSALTVENIIVNGPSYGIYLYSSSSSTLTGNTVKVSGWYYSYSIYVSSSGSCTVSGNIVSIASYHATGIYLRSSGNSTLSGNTVTVSGSYSYGIYLRSSGSSTLTGNTVKVSGWYYSHSIYVSSSGSSTVSGNTVTGSRGIYLYSSSGSTVSGNTITGSRGIYLYSSSGSTVSGNTISGVYHATGIYLRSSGSSTVSGNTISVLTYSTGIYLRSSGSSTVSGNTITGDNYGINIGYSPNVIFFSNAMTQGGITIEGSTLSEWNTHDIDTTNTVGGKPVRYCKDTTGGTILTGAGQVILAGCSNMIVENQDISGVYSGIAVGFGSGNMIRWNMVTDGYYGIYMYSSSGGTVSENTVTGGSYGIYLDSSNGGAVSGNTVTGSYYSTGISLRSSGSKTVSGNTVTDGYYGIRLYYSDSNTVSENIVANNLRYGILLSYSDSNTISHNDFVFNEYQLSNVGSTNTWNNPALEGNYWDDYDGLDDGTGGRTAGDGIGDTNLPHQGVDWYPLMTPYRWNYPPVVFITAPPSGALFPTGTPISFSGYFTDVEVEDTHEAIWSFDGIDVPGTVTESGGSGTVNDEIIFDTAGIYSVKLTVIDDKGGIGTADKVDGLLAQIVVYDPEGAFVTGGGWIHSPPDSYLYDYHATGKATFAFVAKYRKGADIPTGDTEFRFHVADFSFRSDSYDWLVCGGRKCKFKGSGTLTIKWKWGGPWDQEIPVGFMITAVDGDLHNGDGKDRFRIKIWEGDNEWNVIYDNMGLYWWDDDAEPPEIGGGSIVIHKG